MVPLRSRWLRVQADPSADAAEGADDDGRLLPLARGDPDPDLRAEDPFACWRLIHALGAVPHTLVSDGEGAVGRSCGGRVELTGECQWFRGVFGTKAFVLRPREPEHTGVIERADDYLESRRSARPVFR